MRELKALYIKGGVTTAVRIVDVVLKPSNDDLTVLYVNDATGEIDEDEKQYFTVCELS